MTVGSPSPCFFSRIGGAVYAAERKKPPSAKPMTAGPRSAVRVDHDREAHHVDDQRVHREAAAGDHARDHRVRRVEVARVVLGVGADLEIEEVVHDVVRHVREHEAERGKREEAPVDVRVAEHGEQPAESGRDERHRAALRRG